MAFSISVYLKRKWGGAEERVVCSSEKKKSTSVQLLTHILLETFQEYTTITQLSNCTGTGNDSKRGILVIRASIEPHLYKLNPRLQNDDRKP